MKDYLDPLHDQRAEMASIRGTGDYDPYWARELMPEDNDGVKR